MNINEHTPTMQGLRVDILSCKSCGIFRECKAPVPFYGSPKAPILFIGRNPTTEEDMRGLPFFPSKDGISSGKVFERILFHLELTREDVFATNIVKCHTSVPERNRVPSEAELKICSNRFLFKEIEQIKPEIIVTFGKEAYNAVVNRNFKSSQVKITEHAGKISISQDFYPVFALLNPSVMLHNKKYEFAYKSHVFKLKNLWKKYKDTIYRREFRGRIAEEAKKLIEEDK